MWLLFEFLGRKHPNIRLGVYITKVFVVATVVGTVLAQVFMPGVQVRLPIENLGHVLFTMHCVFEVVAAVVGSMRLCKVFSHRPRSRMHCSDIGNA